MLPESYQTLQSAVKGVGRGGAESEEQGAGSGVLSARAKTALSRRKSEVKGKSGERGGADNILTR